MIAPLTGDEMRQSYAMMYPQKRILHQICDKHGVFEDAVYGKCRRPKFVNARDEYIAALRDMGWSLTRIGRELNRHHTTIIAALRRYRDRNAKA